MSLYDCDCGRICSIDPCVDTCGCEGKDKYFGIVKDTAKLDIVYSTYGQAFNTDDGIHSYPAGSYMWHAKDDYIRFIPVDENGIVWASKWATMTVNGVLPTSINDKDDVTSLTSLLAKFHDALTSVKMLAFDEVPTLDEIGELQNFGIDNSTNRLYYGVDGNVLPVDFTAEQKATNNSQAIGTLQQTTTAINTKIGDLSQLVTTDKADIVSALNEVELTATAAKTIVGSVYYIFRDVTLYSTIGNNGETGFDYATNQFIVKDNGAWVPGYMVAGQLPPDIKNGDMWQAGSYYGIWNGAEYLGNATATITFILAEGYALVVSESTPIDNDAIVIDANGRMTVNDAIKEGAEFFKNIYYIPFVANRIGGTYPTPGLDALGNPKLVFAKFTNEVYKSVYNETTQIYEWQLQFTIPAHSKFMVISAGVYSTTANSVSYGGAVCLGNQYDYASDFSLKGVSL